MNCREFVERFSEYRDGTAPADVLDAARAHVRGCARCRRYERVLDGGVRVLAAETQELPEDFLPRLQHRIYHAEAERALRAHASSGASAMAVAAVAVVLTAVAWSPLLRPREPELELPPIVVSDPPEPLRARPANSFPFGAARIPAPSRAASGDLWQDAHTLLLEYSPLLRRYREGGGVRRGGFQDDRQ